jgi:surface antigen
MNLIIVAATASSIALAGCTTEQGMFGGALAGAAAGGVITHSVGGAIVGAGIGALAGAVLVRHYNGYCSYRYHGKMYNDRCY